MLERFKVPEEDQIRIGHEALRKTVQAVLEKMGVAPEDAALAADVLMYADIRGIETHGVSNMLRKYVNGFNDGTLNPRPNVRVLRETSTTAALDSEMGLGLFTAPREGRLEGKIQ